VLLAALGVELRRRGAVLLLDVLHRHATHGMADVFSCATRSISSVSPSVTRASWVCVASCAEAAPAKRTSAATAAMRRFMTELPVKVAGL
jgi:hypothetical protein